MVSDASTFMVQITSSFSFFDSLVQDTVFIIHFIVFVIPPFLSGGAVCKIFIKYARTIHKYFKMCLIYEERKGKRSSST